MTRLPLRIASAVYRKIPIKRLREVVFNAYLRIVRKRHTVRTIEGMTFDLDLSEMIDVGVFLEQYERDLVRAIESLCRPGCCVFDIGANVGAHTLRFGKLTGPTGSVYAFEPTTYAYRKLVRNLELNQFHHVHPFQIALGETNAPNQQVRFRSSWRSDGRHEVGESTVDLVTLDIWCELHAIQQVDLIKLDVDGHEYPVLAGASRILASCKPVILIEAGAWHFQNAARNPFNILKELGFRFWDAKTLEEYPDPDAIRRRLPERDEEMGVSINLVAATTPPALVSGAKRSSRRMADS